jgi:hypothetical protein
MSKTKNPNYDILNRKLEEKYDNFNEINYEGIRI